MKTISGIEFASEHNGTDVFRLIELAYEQGQKDGHSEQLGTNLAEVGTDLVNKRVIDVEGLDEQIRCEMCVNPMHTDRGCDGNCRYDENLYKRIMQTLDERIKQLPSAQPEIIYCKDCVKHNKGLGNYEVHPDGSGTWIWKDSACPLVSWRNKAQGHEFDYQFCAYAERKEVTT